MSPVPVRTGHRRADDLTMTQPRSHTAAAPDRAGVRALLASTPPATPALWATPVEDAAVLALRKHGHLTLVRFDAPDRNGTTLSDLHLGAIRLFDRGIIRLADPDAFPDPDEFLDHDSSALTDTHATWVWNGHRGESMGLALQRWRTLTFLPFQTGFYGLTPEDGMSGPLMVAVLAWHHAHTGVARLDLTAAPSSVHGPAAVCFVEHHRDGTTRSRALPADAATRRLPFDPKAYETAFRDRLGDDFSLALSRHNPHVAPKDRPEDRLHTVHEDRLLHALCTRIAPTLFGTPALSVDLNTWFLHPHGQAPAATADMVPLDVRDALTVLGAPPETCATLTSVRDWLAGHPVLTFGCKDTPPSRERAPQSPPTATPGQFTRPPSPFVNAPVVRGWGHRHTLTLDPHTGTVHTVPPRTDEVRQRFEADHTLSGLLGTEATCAAVARALHSDDPRLLRRTLDTYRFAPVTAARIEAVWRIARWVRDPQVWHPPAHDRTR